MNSEYRRGTVLGLTIAEVFILLIFLILLAFLGLASNWEEKEEEYRADRQLLSVWHDIIQEFQAPEEIRTLHSKATRLEQQLKSSETSNAELHGKIEAMHEEHERLRDENAKLSDKNSALHQQVAAERQEAGRVKADLDTVRRKGQNPPCWYQTVADGGRTREKAHYTFNIGVYDEYMVVRRHPIPPGRADDDNGRPYTEEAVNPLRLDDVLYDTQLSYEEMIQQMKRIRDLGKMRKIRSYSCIFWVKVWDKTSPDAKTRWKEAHDRVLEGLFGTYEVKDDPWPESP